MKGVRQESAHDKHTLRTEREKIYSYLLHVKKTFVCLYVIDKESEEREKKYFFFICRQKYVISIIIYPWNIFFWI